MAYNPGVHDMSGQILASGIDRGIAALGEGIRRAQEERRRKEEEKRAKEAVQAAGSALFGEGFDLKDAPREAWGQIVQLAQAKRDEPMRQLQLTAAQLANENSLLNQALMKLQEERGRADFEFNAQVQPIQLEQLQLGVQGQREAQAQAQRNRAAVGAALNPQADLAEAIGGGASFERLPQPGSITPQSAMRRAAMSGADVATLNSLAETVHRTRDSSNFTPLNFGDADALANPSGQVIVNPAARPRAERTVPFKVGDREMLAVGGKVFDAKTGNLVEAPRPLDPDTESRVARLYEQALKDVQTAKRNSAFGFGESEAEYAARLESLKRAARRLASRLGYANPFPEEEESKPAPAAASRTPAKQRFKVVPE